MAPTFDEVAKARYILLTTFTKDGKPKSDSIEAVATVLDKSEALAVQRAVNKRYGVLGWAFGVYMKLRGLDKKSVGVELKAA